MCLSLGEVCQSRALTHKLNKTLETTGWLLVAVDSGWLCNTNAPAGVFCLSAYGCSASSHKIACESKFSACERVHLGLEKTWIGHVQV